MADWYRHIKGIPASYYKKVSEDLAKSLGGTPDQAPEAYHQVSPATHVAHIKCPILILHGEEDAEVPVTHAHIMAQAIEKAGGEFELKIFKKWLFFTSIYQIEFRKAMDPLVLEFLRLILRN